MKSEFFSLLGHVMRMESPQFFIYVNLIIQWGIKLISTPVLTIWLRCLTAMCMHFIWDIEVQLGLHSTYVWLCGVYTVPTSDFVPIVYLSGVGRAQEFAGGDGICVRNLALVQGASEPSPGSGAHCMHGERSLNVGTIVIGSYHCLLYMILQCSDFQIYTVYYARLYFSCMINCFIDKFLNNS